MKSRCCSTVAGSGLLIALWCSTAAAGPVLISGDAADNHAPPAAYAGLLHQVLSNTTNGQVGILALGADVGSPAAQWIVAVSAALPQPQPVAFVNDDTIAAISFSGYAAIYVPSDSGSTPGGISATENGYLAQRANDLAQFLNSGGGLFALTQGALASPYAYLGAYAPVQSSDVPGGYCAPELSYDDVSATATGTLLGVTNTSLDGCCWRGVFNSFPPALAALAKVNEPGCPAIDGKAAVLGGFVEVDFDDPSEFTAAGEAKVGAVGDLDGDGTPDVVATIPGLNSDQPGSIQVFLNQGTIAGGGLGWQGLSGNAPVTVGKDPSAVAAGLFNPDGHVDLAVANRGDNTLSILINDGSGNGTFLPPVTVAVGQRPSAVVAADFNRDGFVDLAVGHEQDDDFILLLNDGNGNFGGAVPVLPPMGIHVVQMTSGDFDGNKDPDLNGGGSSNAVGAGGFVFVALGNGDGTFAAPVLYPVGADPRDTAVADFDGDGVPDIVSANQGDGTLSLLQGTGGGAFGSAVSIPVGASPTSVDAADFDGDGDPDLAAVAIDPDLGPAVQVLVNTSGTQSAISFQAPQAFAVNASPKFVVTSDMDGDQLPDVITTNADSGPTGGSVTVLLNAPSVLDVPEGLAAYFDVRPNGCPNPLNPASHGLLATALVGSPTFDVDEVNLDSLVLARVDGVGDTIEPIGTDGLPIPPVPSQDPTPQFEPITAPFTGEPCACAVQGADGILDLRLTFRTDKLVEKLKLNAVPHGTSVELVLSGALNDGTPFEVFDCVVVAPPKVPPGLLTVTSTVPGAYIEASPPDAQLDEGGFATFTRAYVPGTVVTLTAPAFQEGRLFLGWKLRNAAAPKVAEGPLIPGNILSITVAGSQTSAQAIFLQITPL